jgi:hypothetical protein
MSVSKTRLILAAIQHLLDMSRTKKLKTKKPLQFEKKEALEIE